MVEPMSEFAPESLFEPELCRSIIGVDVAPVPLLAQSSDVSLCDLDGEIFRNAGYPTYPEPPEVPGGYLENTSFGSSEAPTTLLMRLVDEFQRRNIDTRIIWSKYKIKCHAYPNDARVTFTVRLFATPYFHPEITDKYTVEFQRRIGCSLAFSRIYSQIRDTIGQGGKKSSAWISREDSATTSAVTLDHVENTIQNLVQMATSSCVDVAGQGFMALTQLSADSRLHELLLRMGVLSMWVDHLGSDSDDIHRYCITGLANLAGSYPNEIRALMATKCKKLRQQQCDDPFSANVSTVTTHIDRETTRLRLALE